MKKAKVQGSKNVELILRVHNPFLAKMTDFYFQKVVLYIQALFQVLECVLALLQSYNFFCAPMSCSFIKFTCDDQEVPQCLKENLSQLLPSVTCKLSSQRERENDFLFVPNRVQDSGCYHGNGVQQEKRERQLLCTENGIMEYAL